MMTDCMDDTPVIVSRENLELLLAKPGRLDLTTWCNVRLSYGYPAFPSGRWTLND